MECRIARRLTLSFPTVNLATGKGECDENRSPDSSTAQFETTRRKPSVWRLRFSIWAIGSRRSPWFHPAAAPSKSAPMANRSIPSSIPANGRISTRSLHRSKRPKPDSLGNGVRAAFPGFPDRRVKGAWWPSRSSKSPSALTGRGRFDSYPLRPSPSSSIDQKSKMAERR